MATLLTISANGNLGKSFFYKTDYDGICMGPNVNLVQELLYFGGGGGDALFRKWYTISHMQNKVLRQGSLILTRMSSNKTS